MAIRYADIPPEKETKVTKAAPAKNSPAKQETEKAAPWDREDQKKKKAVTADPGQKQNEEALNKAL